MIKIHPQPRKYARNQTETQAKKSMSIAKQCVSIDASLKIIVIEFVQ